ncbi:MAG TPA: outer membrane beta-barrel protein [Acidobacteriota bacterium]
MRKHILTLLMVLALGAVPAFSNSLTIRIGYFFPEGKSDLWKIEFDQMSFTKSNYQSTAYGLDYELFLNKNFSLVLGFDTYVKNKAGYYRDYVGYEFPEGVFAFPLDYEGDFDLTHAFNVSITPIQAGLKITPLGRKSSFIPYLAAGATLTLWNVSLFGDMIDFSDVWIYEDPDYGDVDIYGVYPVSARQDTKIDLGYYLAGGFQYVVGNKITLQVEVKYFSGKGTWSKAPLFEGFEDFEPFDLSSLYISLGLNYWF